MAGLGRRSHYRKHLTDAVLHDLPEPDGVTQRVARVVGTRGGNMFDVLVAPPSSSDKEAGSSEDVGDSLNSERNTSTTKDDLSDGITQRPQHTLASVASNEALPPNRNCARTPQLAFLPTKFRKLVWIKRNDFVIVECGDDDDEEGGADRGGGFRYVINNILYKDQVKHIKSKGLWPDDPYFADDPREVDKDGGGDDSDEEAEACDEPRQCGGDGAYEDNGIVFDDPDEYMVNTNRMAALRVEDSSSEEDSD